MFVIPIMLFISWQNHNNLWAYIALGLAIFSVIINMGKEAQEKKAASNQFLEALLRNIQAKNN